MSKMMSSPSAYWPEAARGAGIRPLISIEATLTVFSASIAPVTFTFTALPGSTGEVLIASLRCSYSRHLRDSPSIFEAFELS